MECLSPLSIPKPGGKSPADRISVPCGKCYPCTSNKRNEWTFRIQWELRKALTSYFTTMTYDENKIPTLQENLFSSGTPTLQKRDLQLFLKRLRYEQSKAMKIVHSIDKIPKTFSNWPNLRYYCIGEYGPKNQRPHYHGIFLNLLPEVADKFEQTWKNGFCTLDSVNQYAIHYVTGYFMTKHDPVPKHCEQPFSIMSTKPPLGIDYIDKSGFYHKKNKDFTVKFDDGRVVNMPRIYRERIFNIKEREAHNEKLLNDLDQADIDKIEEVGLQRFLVIKEQRRRELKRKWNRTKKRPKL
jgi:hypothetical protein